MRPQMHTEQEGRGYMVDNRESVDVKGVEEGGQQTNGGLTHACGAEIYGTSSSRFNRSTPVRQDSGLHCIRIVYIAITAATFEMPV